METARYVPAEARQKPRRPVEQQRPPEPGHSESGTIPHRDIRRQPHVLRPEEDSVQIQADAIMAAVLGVRPGDYLVLTDKNGVVHKTKMAKFS